MAGLSKNFSFLFLVLFLFCRVEARPLDVAGLGKKAFANFKKFKSPASSSIFCNIWGGAPNQSPWELAGSDVDGNYVVLKYTIPQGVAVPSGWPINIIYSWQLDGLYAPWIVYFGNEKISQVKINTAGDVAFWRTLPSATVGGTGGRDDLISCELDQLNKNNQWTAYPCVNNISSARLVDTIPHNYTLMGGLFGAQYNQPDGKFYDLDWSYDRLVYSRSSASGLNASLNAWDRFNFQTQNIESSFASSAGLSWYWLRQVDSQGNVGTAFMNFVGLLTGGINLTLKGAFPQGLGSAAIYNSTLLYEYQNSLASITSYGATKFGNEYFGFSQPFPYVLATHGGKLGAWSSEDNWSAYHLDRIVSPNPNATLRKPLKLNSLALGEILAIESYDNISQSNSVEIYQYQPSGSLGTPGNFVYIETVQPYPGFQTLQVISASDALGFSSIMTAQYLTPTSPNPVHSLISCF